MPVLLLMMLMLICNVRDSESSVSLPAIYDTISLMGIDWVDNMWCDVLSCPVLLPLSPAQHADRWRFIAFRSILYYLPLYNGRHRVIAVDSLLQLQRSCSTLFSSSYHIISSRLFSYIQYSIFSTVHCLHISYCVVSCHIHIISCRFNSILWGRRVRNGMPLQRVVTLPYRIV
jgi:hypothetical protein